MPQQEIAQRRQFAVLWNRIGYDAHGQPTVGDPEEIKVFWVPKRAQDPIKARAMVAQDILVGSQMWLGRLVDWTGVTAGGEENEVLQVVESVTTPDIKGRSRYRTVSLARFRNSWPSVEGAVQLADLEFSSITYPSTSGDADGIDELTIIIELMDNSGEAIVGRAVTLSLSSSVGIFYNNSPQVTDSSGVAILVLRATAALTTTVTPRTTQDGALFGPQVLTFA